MTAATQDILTPKYGPEDAVLPDLIQIGVESATTIWGGTLVGVDAGGYAVPASASNTLKIVGRAQRQVINTTAAGFGTAGALQVLVDRGAFWLNLNADSTVTIANFGASVYASDDNTVSLSDGGGTRPYVGYLLCVPTTPGIPGMVNGTAATKVAVQVGQPNPYASTNESVSTQNKARAVVTSLPEAYNGTGTNVLTATTNAAFGTQDGVTVAVGDVVFIQAGTTNLTGAVDSGPWTITSLGASGAKYVLTRPDWFTTGAKIALSQTIEIGGEGTYYAGTSWKAFGAPTVVIGTTDPAFYVGRITIQVTLSSGTYAIAAGASAGDCLFGIRSASQSNAFVSCATPATQTGTVSYGVKALTPGYMGTAHFAAFAFATAQATETGDDSVVNVTLINW